MCRFAFALLFALSALAPGTVAAQPARAPRLEADSNRGADNFVEHALSLAELERLTPANR